MRILIAEDDQVLADGLLRTLRGSGAVADHVSSGTEADAALMTNNEFDLLILDLGLPKLHGLEVLKRLRGRGSALPVLILTAADSVEERVKGLDFGADDYMTKPFHSQELQARVRALLKTKVLVEELSLRTRELEQSNAALQAAQQKIVEQERIVVAAQLAGAAAHGLGQPLQSILLHCHVMEKALQNSSGDNSQALLSLKGVKAECEWIRTILSKLESVDPNRLASYVGDETIIDISSAPEIAPEKK